MLEVDMLPQIFVKALRYKRHLCPAARIMAHEIGHLVHLAHYRRHNKDTQHSHYQHGFKQSDSNRQPALLHAKQPLVILHKRLKDVRNKPRH